jgi:hypothetical protein
MSSVCASHPLLIYNLDWDYSTMHAFVRLQPLAEFVAAFLKDGARRLPSSALPPDTLAALAAFARPSRLVALATPPQRRQRRPSPGVPDVPGAACTITLTAAAAAVTAGVLPRELFVGMVTAAMAEEKGETLEAITAALPPGPLEREVMHVGAGVSAASKTFGSPGPDLAFVVGVSDYSALPPSPPSVADAAAVAVRLEMAGYHGVLCVNPSKKQAQQALQRFVGDTSSDLGVRSIVLYFSGHSFASKSRDGVDVTLLAFPQAWTDSLKGEGAGSSFTVRR